MNNEKQQYATIDCKKVTKAKTVSLKLLDQKDEKTQFEKEPISQKSGTLQQWNSHHQNLGFSYLDSSKGVIQKEKSFDEIMNETRKILEMKKKMEDDENKRLYDKKQRKEKRKSKREQKKEKKQRKTKRKQQKKQPLEQDIILTPLDIQRFETEATSIKKIIQKIKFLQNLSDKCDIFAPILSNIEQGNDELISLKQSVEMGKLFKEKQFLAKLQTLQLEIQLMKGNLDPEKETKQILTPFEIQQLVQWQVSSRASNGLPNEMKQSYLVQKYTDSQNLQIHAQELQNELEHIDNTFFSLL